MLLTSELSVDLSLYYNIVQSAAANYVSFKFKSDFHLKYFNRVKHGSPHFHIVHIAWYGQSGLATVMGFVCAWCEVHIFSFKSDKKLLLILCSGLGEAM